MQNSEPQNPSSSRHWTPDQIPFYKDNERTVRVSSASPAKGIAFYALELCSKHSEPVEFFYIGASAGQQAAKAMGIFRYKIEEAFSESKTAVFRPNRVRVHLNTEGGEVVDAIVWQAFVVPMENFKQVLQTIAEDKK